MFLFSLYICKCNEQSPTSWCHLEEDEVLGPLMSSPGFFPWQCWIFLLYLKCYANKIELKTERICGRDIWDIKHYLCVLEGNVWAFFSSGMNYSVHIDAARLYFTIVQFLSAWIISAKQLCNFQTFHMFVTTEHSEQTEYQHLWNILFSSLSIAQES